jgi:hypothetical protein
VKPQSGAETWSKLLAARDLRYFIALIEFGVLVSTTIPDSIFR